MQFDYTGGTLNVKNINISNTGVISTSTVPVAATDVTNKTYVDSVALGLGPKNAVLLKTTAANLTALSGNYTAFGSGAGKYLEANANGVIPNIDSTVVPVNSRILFAHSTTSPDFGIYDVTSIGSAGSKWRLTRSADCDNSPSTGEVSTGIYTLVQSGTVHAQQGWCLITTGTITIDVTGQTWSQITAAGAGASTLDGLNDASTTGGTNNLGVGINVSFAGGSSNNLIFSKTWTGASLTTGSNNLIAGTSSGNALTAGSGNVIFGPSSGTAIDSGNNNIVIGNTTGVTLTTGASNLIFGDGANVSAGASTGRIVFGKNATGTVDNGLFFQTNLASLSNGSTTSKIVIFNTTTGQMGGIADGTNGQALTTNGSGTLTWATIGGGSIDSLTDASTTGGTNNLALGVNETFLGSSANNVIVSRDWTGSSITSAINNVFIGTTVATTITSGGGNVIIGSSNNTITSGSSNIVIGPSAIGALSTGSGNVFIGSSIVCALARANAIGLGAGAVVTLDNAFFVSTSMAQNTTAANPTNNFCAVFVNNTGRLAPCAKDSDIGAMTDSTTGTAGATPYTLNNVTSNAISNDNFAKILAELNAIRDCLRNHGLMA